MAKPTIELIAAMRETAARLRNGVHYAWGHHGACNCGNLLQVVTKFSKEEILRYAHTGIGEWTEMAEEFCPITNSPLTILFSQLKSQPATKTELPKRSIRIEVYRSIP